MAKSKFYFDFYFKGRFIRRFLSYKSAVKMGVFSENLWTIKKVKRKKLSTEVKANKIKGCKKCQE